METQLDPKAKEAIRKYLIQIFTIPAIGLSIISFGLGYMIDKGAELSAEEKVLAEIEKSREKLNDFYYEASKKNLETQKLLIDANSAKESVNELLKNKEMLEKLDGAEKTLNEMTQRLVKNPILIKKIKSSFYNTVKTKDGGYILIGDAMFCWGSQLTKNGSKAGIRTFNFEFPRGGFKDSPNIINSTNTNSSGVHFGTYSINKEETNKKYHGSLSGQGDARVIDIVHMSYVAIGYIK